MYWEEKKGRICWGGGADEEKQENKNRAKEVIGLNSQNNKQSNNKSVHPEMLSQF